MKLQKEFIVARPRAKPLRHANTRQLRDPCHGGFIDRHEEGPLRLEIHRKAALGFARKAALEFARKAARN